MPNTKPIPTERDPVRAALADAIDSPTVAALENVFNGPGVLGKSYSEMIVEILAPQLNRHLPGRLDCGAIDREQIAALLYVTRYPWRTWFMASLDETALAYKQADQIIAALPRAVDGGAEPVAWLDIRTANLGWQNRLVATNPQYVENNGPENFVALYAVPRSYRPCPSNVPGDGDDR